MVISPLGKAYQIIWAGTKQGVFTVRSAYHLAKELSLADRCECSTKGRDKRMWQVIWKLKCPRVLHLFLWKACNNILPTKENLSKRAVTLDDKCLICNLETETIGHSLWSCPTAKDVWMECPSRIQKSPSEEDDFSAIFIHLVERLQVDELQMLVFVAQQIWFRRNDVVFNGEFRPPKNIVQATRLQIEQYDQASTNRNQEDPTKGTTHNQTHVRWMKPQGGVAKINWNAALDERTGNIGLGAIARDHDGRVLAMQCSTCKHIYNPMTAKTLTAWKAVVLGVQMGVIYLELEGDAIKVVQGINCTRHCLGCEGPILNDIKTLLQNFNT